MKQLQGMGVGRLALLVLCLGVNVHAAENSSTVSSAKPNPQGASMVSAIADNMDVGMEYTLTSEGKVVDSTDGKSAFHYVHGRGQIIPGLERQLVGLHVGDSKEIAVKPEEGYGPVDPAAFVEVPKTQLPKDTAPLVGMTLRGVNPDGHSFRAIISEVKDQSVMLNLNHPLAGKSLTFKVKITDIAPAKAP